MITETLCLFSETSNNKVNLNSIYIFFLYVRTCNLGAEAFLPVNLILVLLLAVFAFCILFLLDFSFTFLLLLSILLNKNERIRERKQNKT